MLCNPHERGQGLVEYALIVTFVALIVIALIMLAVGILKG